MKITTIEAYDIPELWFRALWELYNKHKGDSREYMVEQGSYAGVHQRKEFDYFTGRIINPGNKPMIFVPEALTIAPPTTEEAIADYFAHYIMGTRVAPNEDYTYGERIAVSVDRVIKLLKATPNTNQAIIEIGKPEDCFLVDPPCLRLIDCRVKDSKLHFIIYFRSWDLWGGLPQNLGGLQLLKEYMAMEIGVEDGEMIVSSKGLHAYDYVWPHIEALIGYNTNKEGIKT
jgi:thymidylate synthase